MEQDGGRQGALVRGTNRTFPDKQHTQSGPVGVRARVYACLGLCVCMPACMLTPKCVHECVCAFTRRRFSTRRRVVFAEIEAAMPRCASCRTSYDTCLLVAACRRSLSSVLSSLGTWSKSRPTTRPTTKCQRLHLVESPSKQSSEIAICPVWSY